MDAKNDKKPQRPTYPECPTCSKTNQPALKCWRVAGAQFFPKRNRQDTKTTDDSEDEGNSIKKDKSTTPNQANRLQRNLIQNTKFATTPNM